MGINEQVSEKMKQAMREKDQVTLEAMRAIKSAIKYKKAETGQEPDDDEIVLLIQKEAKKRKDSIAEFKRGGRDDLAEKEEAQLKAMDSFLPEEMGDDEIERIVKETIDETGAISKKDMGKVMKSVMPKLKGQADGKKVNQMVSKLLSE